MKKTSLIALITLAAACWLLAGLLWGPRNIGRQLLFTAVSCSLAIAMTWAAQKLGLSLWIYAGLLTLAALFLPPVWVVKVFPYPPLVAEPFELAFTPFLLFSLALVVAAVLFYRGYIRYQTRRDEGLSGRRVGWGTAVPFILGALLLVKAMHVFYWLMIWDSTYDPLDFLLLPLPILVALLVAAFLLIAMPGRAKAAGVGYGLLIPALLIVLFMGAKRVDFRQLTAERTAQTSQALETYYARHGRYPQALAQLSPWTILSVPGPVIIFGQEWCYDGGADYYRLGYVYREHWSDPRLSGRLVQAAGDVPEQAPICAEAITALQQRFPNYPYVYWEGDDQ